MRNVESLNAILERQLIRELVSQIARSETEAERQRCLNALTDLIHHADTTLDARLLDAWTRAYLERNGLAFESQNLESPYSERATQARPRDTRDTRDTRDGHTSRAPGI
jgi:hypothetical protein